MPMPDNRLRLLVSAYSCEPGRGSEPGVGWATVLELARHHDLWVVTRSNNRAVVERALGPDGVDGLRFAYYDLPKWVLSLKTKGTGGVQWYYPLWQIGVLSVFRRLANETSFDASFHLTMGKYYIPSMLPLLKNMPFIWGVVGAGESMPWSFFKDLTVKEILYEVGRISVRRLNEFFNPFLRLNAKRAVLVLAASDQTKERLAALGASRIEVFVQHALRASEAATLSRLPPNRSGIFRFLSIGRATGWKGFHLGLKAFASAGLNDAEYWLLVNGGSRPRLERLAESLGLGRRVRFIDPQPSLGSVYEILAQCDVLVHPALHEAFGSVILEARMSGRPVICLDIGGPGLQVDGKNGIKVSADNPSKSVRDMAEAMRKLAMDAEFFARCSEYAAREARETGLWETRSSELSRLLQDAIFDQ
jgi:glycosyltransferase involved in cell wall biosynthesis